MSNKFMQFSAKEDENFENSIPRGAGKTAGT
jgi:hypothetical protein